MSSLPCCEATPTLICAPKKKLSILTNISAWYRRTTAGAPMVEVIVVVPAAGGRVAVVHLHNQYLLGLEYHKKTYTVAVGMFK
jgi:hypothetical protein